MPTTKVLGSVFLGDAKTVRRHFPDIGSIITPPASPVVIGKDQSETASEGIFSRMQEADKIEAQGQARVSTQIELDGKKLESSTMNMTSNMSLELRLRWLETLLLGINSKTEAFDVGRDTTKGKRQGKSGKRNATLFKKTEELQKRLEGIVGANDGLKKFMERYDSYQPYLTPTFALSGSNSSSGTSPSYASLSSSELDALLSEMEPDIYSADRDLREIEELKKRGVVGAGKMGDCEMLKERLDGLVRRHDEDLRKARELEGRITRLIERHATKVDALSELFVAWNDVITEAEDTVGRVERDQEERRKLGYE